MLSTIASTALVLVREGFESVLLTSMIAAALPDQYRTHINFNFLVTWVLTLVAGWFAVDAIWPYIEHIEHTMMIVTALVLIYIFFNSKSIFAHAKEHADEVKDGSIWMIHLTVFLICLREALESTVFLGSEIHSDPWGVVQGLALGLPFLFALMYAVAFANKDVKAMINRVMFRYVGFALLAMAGYYLFHGITELAEQVFGIDLF
jgi:high-affinity Fe2+/Pb2+ permease